MLREFAIHHEKDDDDSTITANNQQNIAELYTYENFSRFRRAQNEGYPTAYWIPNTVSVDVNVNIPSVGDNDNDSFVSLPSSAASVASTVWSDWY